VPPPQNANTKANNISTISVEEADELKIVVVLLIVFAFISVFGLTFMIRSHRELKNQYKVIEKQKDEIERKNDELAFKNESLEEINIEKNNMLSVVAHDLKTPLTNILGFLELIRLNEESLSQDQKRYMDMIKEVVTESTYMVDNMLDVHKIESELYEMVYTNQLLDVMIDKVIKVHSSLAEAKKIKLVKEDIPSECMIKTDKQYFKQIISNILKNAIENSPEQSEVILSGKENESTVTVSIADKGPGIPDSEQKRLFAGYRKGKVRVGEGAKSAGGFGLVVVMRLIEKLRARISVDSKEGQGSVFTIEFPK